MEASTTDPDSGLFHKGEHKVVFAYGAHVACDKNNFILNVEVTPGNVHDSVVFDDVYEKVVERFPEVDTVVLDAGYKTPWICKKIIDDGRNPQCRINAKEEREAFSVRTSLSTMSTTTVCSAHAIKCCHM